MKPRRWTDDEFRRVADGAWSMLDITRGLGLRQTGPTNQMIRRHAERLGIELRDGRQPRPPAVPSPLARAKCPTPSGVDGEEEGR